MIDQKAGRAKPPDDKSNPISESIILQANILEAGYQDTLLQNDTNAKAAFELMCQEMDSNIECLEETIMKDIVIDGKLIGISSRP